VENLNGHKPAAGFRGGKYSSYEAGTRMPFIVTWPARVKPGVSDALVSQIDLLSSLAELTGQKLPADAAPDSLNTLAALLGESKQGREYLVEHARGIALRKGPWKLVPPGAEPLRAAGLPTRSEIQEPELYNIANDVGETKNVAAANPVVVQEMTAFLDKIRKAGRTRP
jgi:arylsulfatase A-like enzyme